MSFIPNIGSHVILSSGEFGVVSKITPEGLVCVKVIREWHSVPMEKEVRITINQIREVLFEPDPE